MGSIISRCFRVDADGAKVNVTTNVKDLVTVNVGGDKTEDRRSENIAPSSSALDPSVIVPSVISIKRIRLDTNPHIYIDTKDRSFVRDVSGSFRDINGERFIEL